MSTFLKAFVIILSCAALLTSNLTAPARASGISWHVSLTGVDSPSSGSLSSPFRSIQYAIDFVSSGDTVIVASGTFVENITINKSITLSCANAGTSAGWQAGVRGPETIIQGEMNLTVPNIIIDGCKFLRPDVSSTLTPRLIESIGVTGEIILRNSIIDLQLIGAATTTRGCGAGTFGGAAWRIYSNKLLNQRYGSTCTVDLYNSRMINADGAQKVLIRNNIFSNTSHGIFITGKLANLSEITNNSFEILQTAGIFIGTTEYVLVSGNTFDGYGGVYLDKSVGTQIKNNVFTPNNWYALSASSSHTGTVVKFNSILGAYPVGYPGYTGITLFNDGPNSIDARQNYWGLGINQAGIASKNKANPGLVDYSNFMQDTQFVLDSSKNSENGFWPLFISGTVSVPINSGETKIIDFSNSTVDSNLVEELGNPVLTFTPTSSGSTEVTLTKLNAGDAASLYVDSGGTPFLLNSSSIAFDLDIQGLNLGSAGLTICVDGSAPNKLWHFQNGNWSDITTSYPSGKICGVIYSLSPFLIAGLPEADATPSSIDVAPTSTVTTRVALAGMAGNTLAFAWVADTAIADATDYSWKILEHSASVSSNVYQGAITTGFTMTWGSTDANAYVLVQVRITGAVAGEGYDLVSDPAGTALTEVDIDTVAAGTASVAPAVANATDTPWRIDESYADSDSKANLASLSGSEVVTSATNDVRIYAEIDDTVVKAGSGSYRYVEVTGGTIKAVAGSLVIDGLANSATRALVLPSGNISDGTSGLDAGDAQVWVNAGATGTVTMKFYDRSVVSLTGAFYETLLQTITFTITAPGAISPQASVAYIHAEQGTAATTGVATSQSAYTSYVGDFSAYDCSAAAGVQACDFSIVAPVLADPTTPKAVIEVRLKDADENLLVGTLPAIGASIAGAGTLSISDTLGGEPSQGRSLSKTAAPASVFYINVFSDGTAGTGTISILVGGSVWKTKTIKFYSTLAKVEAVAGLSVLKSGTTSGCMTSLAACDGETVATSVATTLLATDANGTPVPFVTYKQVSSDATILVGNASATTGQPGAGQNAHYLGASWFPVTTMPSVDSGKSATMTYTTDLTATTTLSSNALTFKIGGAPTAATLTIANGKSVGEKGTMTINVKDAAGNAIYDSDHTVAFTTNIALASGAGLLSGAGAIAVRDGKTTIDFFNPVVPGTVTVTGLVSTVLPIAGSFTVTNASQDAATDAALNAQKEVLAAIAAAEAASDAAAEAIDAANAATDAANLAAEAADAATVAAEEARDAADAATAAVEELATQVAALMAALKAQITTLANTVAKIAKKVKA